MLRLRECIILSRIVSSACPISTSLHRLLSAAAAPISPAPAGFAVEDYLVGTCGLNRPQALKASAKLSHLRSPSKPDAVLAFLTGLGLSKADVSALVAKDPQFLCASVERTLAPNIVDLTGLGLSRPDIARLILLSPQFRNFRFRSISSKLQYHLSLFGCFENLLRVLKQNPYLLGASVEKVVKPNVAFMRECGLSTCNIVRGWSPWPTLLADNPERVQAMVARAEGLGVPRWSGMFPDAVFSVRFHGSKEKLAAQVEYLKKTFRWSDAEVGIAVSKAPQLLRKSKDMLQRRSEFLLSEVRLEPVYIAHRPNMVCLSLEGRLRPRYYFVKFLKANGLVKNNWSYCTIVLVSDKVFVEKFIQPHKEAALRLAEDYAAACRGELPDLYLREPGTCYENGTAPQSFHAVQ